MNRFEIQHLALYAWMIMYQQHINTFEHLENASHGWTLCGLTHLVGNAFIPFSQFSAQRSQ